MHPIGGPRQHACQLLGLGAVDLATQGDHALAAFHFDSCLFGNTAPEQPGSDHRCQGGVLQTLGIGAQFKRPLDQRRVYLQLVVDLLDAVGGKRDMLGQLTLDIVFHLAGQPGVRAIDCHFDAKGVEHPVQRQSCLQGALQARVPTGSAKTGGTAVSMHVVSTRILREKTCQLLHR